MTAPAPPVVAAVAAVPVTPLARARDFLVPPPTWLSGLLGLLAMVGLWWIAAIIFATDSGVLVAPPEVFAQLAPENWTGKRGYLETAMETLVPAVKGFLWGNILAFGAAVIVLLVPGTRPVIVQLAVVTYCIPITAIGPIAVLVTERGSGHHIVFLAALSCFYTTTVGCILGWESADRTALDVVRAYGGGRWVTLRKIQVIAALPSIMAALKIAAPAAFLGAVIAEFMSKTTGFGQALDAAQIQRDYPLLWALAIVSGIVAGAWYALVAILAKYVTAWSTASSASSGKGL